MTKDDFDEFFVRWQEFTVKVFTYKRQFMPDDYLVIRKDMSGNIILDLEHSTTKIDNFDGQLFEQMVISGDLVFKDNHWYSMKVRDLKTGGCECGSWATKDSKDRHYLWCSQYRYWK